MDQPAHHPLAILSLIHLVLFAVSRKHRQSQAQTLQQHCSCCVSDSNSDSDSVSISVFVFFDRPIDDGIMGSMPRLTASLIHPLYQPFIHSCAISNSKIRALSPPPSTSTLSYYYSDCVHDGGGGGGCGGEDDAQESSPLLSRGAPWRDLWTAPEVLLNLSTTSG